MKKLSVTTIVSLIVFITTTNTACKKEDNNTLATPTLYDSLGGTTMVVDPKGGMIEKGRLGIRSVVDSTIFVIAGDPQLNGFFPMLLAEVTSGNLTGFNALSKNLTDFFCVATGAKNFTYTGKSMVDAHDPAKHSRMPAKANNANFDRFIANLVKGAQQVGLSNDLIGRVGRVTETTRTAVVQR